jgi:hypothetical protein
MEVMEKCGSTEKRMVTNWNYYLGEPGTNAQRFFSTIKEQSLFLLILLDTTLYMVTKTT